MVRNINVKRTRNLSVKYSELELSDYEMLGEFPAYDRLADFMWHIFKEEIMPEGFEIEDDDDPEDEATIIQGDFLGRWWLLSACANFEGTWKGR